MMFGRMRRTGEDEGMMPCCPCCGMECSTFYRDSDGYVFACENCLCDGESYDYTHGADFVCPFCGNETNGDETIKIFFDAHGDVLRACEECIEESDSDFEE